jgi:hypothetical protein
MAVALIKRKLADRLGCAPQELPLHAFEIASAGAVPGGTKGESSSAASIA